MLIACGGIKGGVGKTTLATNLTVLRSLSGKDVLLIDADNQETASDFTIIRNERLEEGAGYTSVKLHGSAVRTDTLRLSEKYDDVVIDVGGRDTAGQRAAMSIADIYVVPFLPGSFDVWTFDKVSQLVEEAQAFNPKLKCLCVLNRADPSGRDNDEAAEIARETPNLIYLDTPLGSRKAFRNAASQGLAVTEVKPKDKKAIAEIDALYRSLFDIN